MSRLLLLLLHLSLVPLVPLVPHTSAYSSSNEGGGYMKTFHEDFQSQRVQIHSKIDRRDRQGNISTPIRTLTNEEGVD